MQTFLHYRWRVPSTLHRLHPRRIIPLLLLALCVTGAKAQTNVTFNDGVRYSQWVIDSRLGDFYGNKKKFGFTTYDRDLNTQTTVSNWLDEKGGNYNIQVDYVAGLVAKATIEAAEYYKNFDWAKPWFKSVEWYGNKCTVPTSTNNLDAINASKMYFGIYNLANGSFSSNAESTTASKATTQLGNALTALGNYNQEYKSDGTGGYAFPANTTVTLGDKSISLGGGWFHKKSYLHEMWLDGQYMGPATLAQLIKGYSSYTAISDNDWKLITKQFSIVWNMCWDDTEKLLYHAFCSEPRSTTWAAEAEIWTTAKTSTSSWKGMSAAGHSAAFWGRAEGWYFLALVDVLEQMQKAGLDQSTNDNYSCYTTLKGYLDALALGIAKRQDETTGCWYQLIGKGGEYSAQYYNGDNKEVTNYLESSCTAIFAAAFLKATRLNLLSSFTDETKTYNYKEIGTNAYKGAVAQFMKQRTDGTVDLLGCCKSAGLGTATLGNAKFRDGSNAYYLLGNDVPPTSSSNQSDYYTEGKVMGAFIMAATEYEIANPKDIRFSYDLAPTYTLAKSDALKVEALGSGAETATYQWYKTDGTTGTAVKDATSATFSPTESGSYYCEAKSGSTTIKTSPTKVTVETDGIENGGSENGSGSKTVTINKANPNSSDITYTISAGETWNSSDYYKVDGNATFTVKAKEGATISQIKLTYTETGDNRVGGSVTVNTGTYTLSDKVGTWTGSANQVVFTTTNIACISSIEVTYTTGTTVLNESDLKYTQSYTNNKAWTPAVNGTIEVGNLVTSSSKGAYSITTGNDDVAQISGTTITALKAGTFTLSQEADDKYKAGSIDITVRIGTNVTSDGTNKYSFTAEKTDVSDNMTITRDNITMTFGNDGFWSQPSANSYTNGQRNPKDSDGKDPSAGKIPSIGTFYKFTPTKPGSLAVKIKLGTTEREGSYYLRPLYVSENGTFISAKLTGDFQVGTGQAPLYSQKSYEGDVTFDVKKGKDYYVYVTGSKLGFYDFVFTTATVYTVTYNMNGHGTQIDAVTDDNTLPETLPTPTADGYTFVGWYTNAELTQEATAGATLTSDVTLYAKWTPITDLFSLTGVTSTTKSVASKTAYDVKSADATVTGGSVQLYNGNSNASADMIINSQINLKGSGGSYIKITLDNTLKAGDEIIINPETSSFKLSAEESTSNVKTVTGRYVIQTGDAVVGQNVIYLYRNENSVIDNISISRYYPESDSRATFKYNGTAITFSEKTTGVYTTTLEIGARKKGETITITPSVQNGASIKEGETVVSGDINIAVPSEMGKTTTYTYTVTSKDGTSTTTYEIIVKLVKDNVVLVYSNSGGTAWTWDQTTSSTQPTFEPPTLKAYLANEDGTASSTEVTIKTNIKYLSDVKDVATVDEENGTITIKSDANGGAKIYAILKGHPDYNDAQTFFNILVKQGYSYSVAGDATIEKGPSLNTSVYIKKGEENLVKMTFGGWKWKTYKDDQDNNKVKSKYLVNGSEKTDQWNAAITSDEETIASIDGYKTSVSGATDAVDEAKAASDTQIYGSIRYGWFKPAKERTTDHYLETYPYTLPVRGAYMTFEPTQNGKLTVYILQNGAWNTFDKATTRDGVSYAKGDIIPGEFRPHSFYICNQRGLNVSQFSPKTFNVATKQKVQGKYYCDSKNPDKQSDPYNIATWTEFKDYMSKAEQADVEANWKSGINGAQEIVKLDNGSYLAIQKGIVKYTFFVTANETYYLFSNFSKLGFCGANFVPSETVVPANDDDHKMTLSDETAYPTITKPDASATGEDQYKYKFGGTVKGYVKGFTIPLFKSITLNREFKKDQWTTLSLPFNLTQTEVEQIFGEGTQVLVFDDATTTDVTKLHVKFFYHEIQNILPGYPYLIRPTLVDANGNAMITNGTSTDQAPTYTIGDNENLTSFTVYDKAINPNIEEHKFQATTDKNYIAKVTPGYCTENTVTFDGKDYPYSTKYDTGDLFISDSDGKLYESAGDSYGKGYRSFIDYTGNSFASKSLTISFSGVDDSDDNGGTTEIKVAELDNGIRQALGFVGVYNLNGQKVAETTHNLPAGIYIVNGRKLVVK